jgi:hypothetical protein
VLVRSRGSRKASTQYRPLYSTTYSTKLQNQPGREADRFSGLGVVRPVVQGGITVCYIANAAQGLTRRCFNTNTVHPGLSNVDRCSPLAGPIMMLWQGLTSMLRWTGGTSPSATDALVGSSRGGVRVRPNICESTYCTVSLFTMNSQNVQYNLCHTEVTGMLYNSTKQALLLARHIDNTYLR